MCNLHSYSLFNTCPVYFILFSTWEACIFYTKTLEYFYINRGTNQGYKSIQNHDILIFKNKIHTAFLNIMKFHYVLQVAYGSGSYLYYVNIQLLLYYYYCAMFTK